MSAIRCARLLMVLLQGAAIAIIVKNNTCTNEVQYGLYGAFGGEREGVGRMIESLFEKIDQGRMKKDLEGLCGHYNRYYKSPTGRAASEWVYERALAVASTGSQFQISVQRIVHRDWPQRSVRVRVDNARDPVSRITKERLVLSAHIDSTSQFLPMLTPAPGADDDGSGTVTQLEVLRVLAALETPIRLHCPIEFHFYSAEEGGLLGSKEVVQYYKERGLCPKVLHIDMDGYVKRGTTPGIGLLTDNTDAPLGSFVRRLIRRYTALPVKETACGYACSDHASWHAEGYPAVALFEGRFEEMSPHVHTRRDTIDSVDFGHMVNFVKVAIAFSIHLAI